MEVGGSTKTNNDVTSLTPMVVDKPKHMMFEEGKRFHLMEDMDKIPFFDNADEFLFFEPRPIDKPEDNSLEGCLAY